jgi:3-oxoacyl-[acyl-carrier-protein] synthase-3
MAILGTGTARLPSLSTATIASRLRVSEADLLRKTGIEARNVAPPEATFGALGAEAVGAALEAAGLEASSLERIILVTSTGGDDLAPASANHVAKALGLGRTLDCFDLNNACCGFLTALDIAARCLATGYDRIAIVTIELLSRFIDPGEPRCYAIFGDGVAAVIVGKPRGLGAILGSYLANDPADLAAVRMVHPALSREAPLLRFGESNERFTSRSLSMVSESVTEALRRAGTAGDGIRWFVPHQPNGPLLDRMLALVGAAPSQYVRVVVEHGSLGAASLPVGLDALVRSGRVAPRDHALLFGVGGGAAYGAMVLRFDGAEET